MSSNCPQHTKLTRKTNSMPTWALTLLLTLLLTIPQTNTYANPYISPYSSFNKSKEDKKNGNDWQTLKNCRLVENKGNDGDSFHVLHKNNEYVFRLYMVDCPETKYDYSERILKQMEYFNKSHQEIIQVGEIAKEFTKALLKSPFTVYTRGEDAMGSKGNKRTYGFVVTSKGKDLGEMLLKEGLARSYGKPPSGPKINPRVRTNYNSAQTQAQKRGHGVWTRLNKDGIKGGTETSKALANSSIRTATKVAEETSKSEGIKTQMLLESIKNTENNRGRTSINSKKEDRYTISKEELEILLPKAKELDYETHKSN